jgi:hypothetical protein
MLYVDKRTVNPIINVLSADMGTAQAATTATALTGCNMS